jgi:capsular polysaccharide biosynthesis protein
MSEWRSSYERRSLLSWLTPGRVLIPVVAAAIAGLTCWLVLSRFVDWPVYRADATLLIERTADRDQNGATAEGIAIAQQTAAALIVREPMVSTVNDTLGLGLSSSQLVDALQIDRPEGAPIIEILATHHDPETAALIANTVANEAARLDSPMTGMSVLSEAATPTSPQSSSYILVALAALVGGQVALGGVLLRERLAGKVHDTRDLVDQLDLTLIGVVQVRESSDNARIANSLVLTRVVESLPEGSRTVLYAPPTKLSQDEDFLRLHERLAVGDDRKSPQLLLLRKRSHGAGYFVRYHTANGELVDEDLEQWLNGFGEGAADREDQDTATGQDRTTSQDGGPLAELLVATKVPGEGNEAARSAAGVDSANSVTRVIVGLPVLTDTETALRTCRKADAVVILIERGATAIEDVSLAQRVLSGSGINVVGAIVLR